MRYNLQSDTGSKSKKVGLWASQSGQPEYSSHFHMNKLTVHMVKVKVSKDKCVSRRVKWGTFIYIQWNSIKYSAERRGW